MLTQSAHNESSASHRHGHPFKTWDKHQPRSILKQSNGGVEKREGGGRGKGSD